ncbi:NlpC/P60 family protein [Actinoplanes sp. M2I2]|uniref:C40 family peptidase n=1 Tax=Actinoplanes sp. M2I2 TaxID=1734444 RepID=UPI002022962A|nr:NlpC/P60 family protein [Actinoplanes sp. M2I2]
MPPAHPVGPGTAENLRIEERTTTTERASRAAPRRPSLAHRAAPAIPARTNPFAVPDGGQALRAAVELAVVDEREALRTVETLAAVEFREHLRGNPAEVDEVLPGETVAGREALLDQAEAAAREIAARRALQVRKVKLRALRETQRAAALAAESPRAYDGTGEGTGDGTYDRTDDRTYDRTGDRSSSRRYDRVAPRHLRSVVTKHATAKRSQRVMRLGSGMTAVIAFARSQVGKRYVSGGLGPNGFDCSGFTKRAYALAGIRLPHSSGAQAARSRSVSRAQARPGDLVVGPGHVGIYMGRGMMIDAGNHRTGVVYRKVYNGLRVARIGG